MNKKASILMISLWITAILATFAVGLGQRASISLRLARNQRDKLRARLLCRGAINKATAVIAADKTEYDSLENDDLSNNMPAFRDILVDEAKTSYAEVSYKDPDGTTVYGLLGEEGKININALVVGNVGAEAIARIFTNLGDSALGAEDAISLARILEEWISPAKEEQEEKRLYKNAPLGSTGELGLVLEYFYKQTKKDAQAEESSRQLLKVLEGVLTVFPVDAPLPVINVNIATNDTLGIFFKVLSVDQVIADKTIAAIEGKRPFKNSDDLKTQLSAEGCPEDLISKLKIISSCFSIYASAQANEVRHKIYAVAQRNGALVYWHED